MALNGYSLFNSNSHGYSTYQLLQASLLHTRCVCAILVIWHYCFALEGSELIALSLIKCLLISLIASSNSCSFLKIIGAIKSWFEVFKLYYQCGVLFLRISFHLCTC
uniref:Uncharacterized protein n=1 Tax=Rhipicephalus microplus TaxID=6941 RepID=A0A6G5AI54_RHIMP